MSLVETETQVMRMLISHQAFDASILSTVMLYFGGLRHPLICERWGAGPIPGMKDER